MTQMRKRLGGYFKAKVLVSCSPKGKGKISIPFENEEDMKRIVAIMDQLAKND